MFDSHCHLQMEQYDNDRDEMIRRALDVDVSMICVGTDLKTSKQGIELAKNYEGVWATTGIHPNDVSDLEFRISDFQQLLAEPKVVGIGEVGLDYYRTPEPEKQKKQKEVFEQFIDLAQRTKKPMILHFRDSSRGSMGKVHQDALAMLPKDIQGVSHSFTGNLEDAKKYINRGMYLGFNGIITFARQYDEVVKYIPLDKILLETDAPFLSPEPHRSKRNEPAYVIEVAKKLAELKNEPSEKIIEQTAKNCKKLFGLL